MVVAFHAGLPLPGGSTGVDVFFVISGFVITGTLGRELATTGRIDLPRFYVRRIKRLLPALAAMLTFVAVAGILLDPAGTGHVSASTGVYASIFAANFFLYTLPTGYFAVSAQLDPLLHTWTLAVEEQFYLVFPTLLLGSWWFGARILGARAGRVAAFAAIAIVSIASFVLAVIWSGGSPFRGIRSPFDFAFYGSPARAWEFGIGASLALAVPLLRRLPMLGGAALAAFGAALVVLAAAISGQNTPVLTSPILIAVVGAAALIAAGTGTGTKNSISQLLEQRLPVFVGNLSYSVYLWHWPLIVFARALFPSSGAAAPIAAGLSLVPAWLSYCYVENPIRFNARIRGRAVIAMAAACVALPIIASMGLAALQSHLPIASAAALHADYTRGCDSIAPFGDASRTQCTWAVANPRGTVVLLGDSNAGQFTEPFAAAARRARYDATVTTLSNCPFVQLRVHFRLSEGCAQHNRRSLAALLRARPSLVIIAARTDAYIDGTAATLGKLDGDSVERSPARKARLFVDGLRTELQALNRIGVPVIVVHPIPLLPENEQTCAVVLLMLSSCRGSLSRVAVDRELRAAIAVENEAMQGLPLSPSLDFESELCTRDRCASRRAHGGLIMYRDEDHLSVDGSLTLAPEFYDAIRAHAATRTG
jgi:peptidoglycan/LPS O-acetylase OafA/YrhL